MKTENEKTVFEVLNAVNCNEHTEKKNNLTYLSWAWAWGIVKKHYAGAKYTIYENENGWCYFTDGRTCWVKTGVTINELEHIEYLPVMDFRNASISAEKVTSFDVNKAIQRSLTKACARHGLGLYIYAGEDLPEDDNKQPEPAKRIDPINGVDNDEIPEESLSLIKQLVKEATTFEDLNNIFKNWTGYQRNETFLNLLGNRKKELQHAN